MGLTKRIIPCLDVKDGATVKGINFEGLRVVGDAAELAARYAAEGADELVFLDIAATNEGRGARREWVERVARRLDIPFTVGGGVGSVDDVSLLLECGADKVSVNTAAVRNPRLIGDMARQFGSQCVVLAIDINFVEGEWWVYLNGGRVRTDIRALDWARRGVEEGAGEILLTSMRHDGTKTGFALDITRAVSEIVGVPVIASGGGGTMAHFADVLRDGGDDLSEGSGDVLRGGDLPYEGHDNSPLRGCADAALAASVFHYGEIAIPELKKYLAENGIPVRMQ